MTPAAFREVAAEAFVHATESEAAVSRALASVVPGVPLDRLVLGGHFGQSLLRLTAKTTDKARVAAAVATLRRAAGPEICASARERVSEDLVLHIRIDKQAAAGGTPRVAQAPEGDVVLLRFRLRAPRLTPEAAVILVQQAFGAPTSEEEE